MRKWQPLILGLVLAAAWPAAEARAQVRVGPQVVLFDLEDVGVGGRLDIGLGEAFSIQEGFLQGLFASVNANYVFQEGDVSTLVLNGNLAVPFSTQTAVTPYVGVGFDHTRTSVEGFDESFNDSGLNVLGGLFFDMGRFPAVAEVQYSTTGNGYLTLALGLLFQP